MFAHMLLATAVALVVALGVAGLVARLGFPLPMPGRRIGCIDGLRGVLAVSVLCHHFVIWFGISRLGGAWAAPEANVLNQLGAGAVGLFFMITGLVFYPRIAAGVGGTRWAEVLVGRAFRLLPAACLSVALVMLVLAWRTGRMPDGDDLLAALQWVLALGEPPLLGVAESWRVNGYVLWSLGWEWTFTLLMPVLAAGMAVLRRVGPGWAAPALLLALLLGAQMLRVPFLGAPFWPLFAVGMLAHECRRSPTLVRALRSPWASLACLAGLGAGAAWFATPYGAGLPFFAAFFLAVACGNSMFGLLRSRAALTLGECSYAIYLLHGILLSVLFVDAGRVTAGIAPMLLLPVAAGVMAALAPASCLLVERPAVRLGAWLVRRWGGARPSPGTARGGQRPVSWPA